MSTTNIFNGATKVSGYFEGFSGGRALIYMARGDFSKGINSAVDKNNELNKGFLVESYTIGFRRGIQPRRFLNDTGIYYNVGFGTGTIDLRGIVGKKEALDNILLADGNDICNPLTIVVFPNFFTECKDFEKVKNDQTLAYVCGQCMASNIGLTGNVDAQGITQNGGNITFNIGSLQTTTAAKPDVGTDANAGAAAKPKVGTDANKK